MALLALDLSGPTANSLPPPPIPAPPSAWRSWAAMMLAGSLLAAIADARAWRNWCGWASSPALAASRAKARLAWLGLTGVPRWVRNTRSSWTG